MSSYRERRSIRDLEEAFQQGDKKPLSDLLRAWAAIQELDPKDPNSFFMIAGYHGEPFRGAGWGNPSWWGGYCNHGNVLFPTWHRAYLWRLENALRSVQGCENVTLPYWDECDEESRDTGLPDIFTAESVTLDTGEEIANPLLSYSFQEPVWDNLSFPPIISDSSDPKINIENPNPNYYKYPGYKTVRYPFSGLTSESTTEQAAIDEYNTTLKELGPEKTTQDLNAHIRTWLTDQQHGIYLKFQKCLEAPNYTVFSNTTSAAEYNERVLNIGQGRGDESDAIVPLESPHNDMHLAVGGFNYPGLGNFDTAPFSRANGDMGENETASFDPIFFFHHCFIDKTFWEWQKLHEATKELNIIDGYPGTNSVDNQGPTPGVAGGTWLTMKSPLEPFKKGDDPSGLTMTSEDVVDIESQLGYTYIDPPAPPSGGLVARPSPPSHFAIINGVNRGAIGGSFVIAAYKEDNRQRRTLLGYETVLSRWHTSGCANCQNHLNVKAFIPIPSAAMDDVGGENGYRIVPVVIPRKGSKGNLLVGGQKIPQPRFQLVKAPAYR